MSDCNCGDLHVGNTSTVELFDVAVDGTPRNDAVATVTVTDKAGNPVANGNAVPMPNVSSGTYQGVLPDNLGIVVGTTYLVIINASIAGAGVGRWEFERKAKKRGRC